MRYTHQSMQHSLLLQKRTDEEKDRTGEKNCFVPHFPEESVYGFRSITTPETTRVVSSLK